LEGPTGGPPAARKPGTDVRRFHEAVIGSGAMPMSVLVKHVDWWVAQEKQRK
jgi:uncharacterized protein (DUF885 family)